MTAGPAPRAEPPTAKHSRTTSSGRNMWKFASASNPTSFMP